jgi:hypothetical protein
MADNVFTDFRHTPTAHFRLCFFSAVLRLVTYLRDAHSGSDDPITSVLERFPFLSGYLTELHRYMPEVDTWNEAAERWDQEIDRWAAEHQGHLPLVGIWPSGDRHRARAAFVLAGLVEEESRCGAIFSWLQGGERRPTIETIGRVLPFDDAADGWTICEPLVSAGLVEVQRQQSPRSEWTLRVPSMLWDAGRGHAAAHVEWCRCTATGDLTATESLVAPDGFANRVRRVAPLIGGHTVRTVVVRGSPGSDRVAVLEAVARSLGRGVVTIAAASIAPHWPSVGPLAALTHAMPVVIWDAAPGESLDLPRPIGYDGPVGIAMGMEGGLVGWAAERAVSIAMPESSAPDRQRIWAAAVRTEARELRTISERFRLPAAYIRQAAGAATAHAGLEGRDRVGVDDVQAACRMLNRQLLDSLATRLDGNGSWSHLVVSEGAQLKLRELERRCRHREALQERLAPGFGSGNRGVRALFTGPSGTGKTLAARILASRSVLGLDLYRVDLAAVVNKYIGETEKNLHRILTRAEELDVILLLDEGDALLGQRTEVKSANDRYANLETNYLLQRLETYQGIVIVTTNAAEHIDTAFQRRMDVVVNFVAPQAQERWRIWRLHLPADHVVETQFLDDIAKRCALSGGQIRNAALLATLLAVDAGEVMQRRHVAQAIDSEYRKAGAISPLRDIPATPSQDAAMRAFINALST